MNRNIQVSVLGIQDFGCESETVSTRAYGQYDFQNGLHKVSYCELDSNGTATDNTHNFRIRVTGKQERFFVRTITV